jgi:quinolinate synthase
MKLNTLEKLYNCLLYELPAIEMDADLIERAKKPIVRMLDISAKLGL